MFTKNFLKKVAAQEKVSLSFLQKQLSLGRAVIANNNRRVIERPAAIGECLKVKTNTNIGVSDAGADVQAELAKLKIAVSAGTDAIMDLSVGSNLTETRRILMRDCPVPVGTVPIYQIASQASKKTGDITAVDFAYMFDVLKEQAEDGVDFFTIHAGVLRRTVANLKKKPRVGGVVSRGGAMLTRWMHVHGKENPFYENFDTILDLAKTYNITLSLGDGLRPGAVADSSDSYQLAELKVLGELVKRCRKKGVQVMVEGPGHIRLDEIVYNMRLQKKICHNAPFYILGPLPTDIAAGYDHITAAIGGAIAAMAGADFLCVVTPAEHLRHPAIQDIKDGVIAARIAAHSVDILRFKDEWERDRQLSLYRSRRDWKNLFPLTIDEEKARRYRDSVKSADDVCSMCGDYCPLKIMEKCDLIG